MQKSKIKKIGNSWYIKIPPKMHKQMKLSDNTEIYINDLGNKLEIRFDSDEEIDDYALSDLNKGLSLGAPIKFSREELYYTIENPFRP